MVDEPKEIALNPGGALAVSGQAWMKKEEMQYLTRYAEFISNSDMIPISFKGKPANIMLALQFAARMQIDPMAAMQGIYVFKGNPGLKAQFAISLANHSGIFSSRIDYDYKGVGESLEVTAFATLKASRRIVEASASMAMAKAEGWTSNSKYQSMPRQMLSYRAATFLIRLYAPEIMSGMPIAEEIEMIEVDNVQVRSSGIAGKIGPGRV